MAGQCAGRVAPSMNCLWVMIADYRATPSAACRLAPMIILADDQAIEQAVSEEFSAVGSSAERLEVTSTRAPNPRACATARSRHERRQMHHAGAGLQRAEEN